MLTIVRYGVADVWIWARDPLGREAAQTHDYDIHGLLSVRSAVALPELEGFRAKRPLAKTDIEVRLGNPSSNGHVNGNGNGKVRRIHYREGLPGLGFGVEITIGSRIDVTASPALRFSPHVLYTNVVEPILRWTFVEQGYALVHGACLAVARVSAEVLPRVAVLPTGAWYDPAEPGTVGTLERQFLQHGNPPVCGPSHRSNAARDAAVHSIFSLRKYIKESLYLRCGRRAVLL